MPLYTYILVLLSLLHGFSVIPGLQGMDPCDEWGTTVYTIPQSTFGILISCIEIEHFTLNFSHFFLKSWSIALFLYADTKHLKVRA